MTKILFISLFIFFITKPVITLADTVDVWTIKLNGKTIIHSNETEILYLTHPMSINLSSFADKDILQIYYWTDSCLERYKWYYLLEDVNNKFLEKFTNSLNTGTNTERNNYISFSVQSLRQLMKRKGIEKLFIEFQHDNKSWGRQYLHKPVCIISKN